MFKAAYAIKAKVLLRDRIDNEYHIGEVVRRRGDVYVIRFQCDSRNDNFYQTANYNELLPLTALSNSEEINSRGIRFFQSDDDDLSPSSQGLDERSHLL